MPDQDISEIGKEMVNHAIADGIRSIEFLPITLRSYWSASGIILKLGYLMQIVERFPGIGERILTTSTVK
jgi:hypothetical protein